MCFIINLSTKTHGGVRMNTETLKMLNTQALVQLYQEGKLEFGECLNKISIVGDLSILSPDQLTKGKIVLTETEW